MGVFGWVPNSYPGSRKPVLACFVLYFYTWGLTLYAIYTIAVKLHHTQFIFFSVLCLPSVELKVFDTDAEHNAKEHTKCDMQNCDQEEVVALQA